MVFKERSLAKEFVTYTEQYMVGKWMHYSLILVKPLIKSPMQDLFTQQNIPTTYSPDKRFSWT